MISINKQNIVIETDNKTSTDGERKFHSAPSHFQENVELKIRREFVNNFKKCLTHDPVVGSEFGQRHCISRVETRYPTYFSEIFSRTDLSDMRRKRVIINNSHQSADTKDTKLRVEE